MDDTFVKEHIRRWSKAWTDHNIKDLEEYFCSGLTKFPMLHFTPVDYSLKNQRVIYEYNATPDNKIQWSVIEKFEFNNDGLIEKSSVYYGKEDLIRDF